MQGNPRRTGFLAILALALVGAGAWTISPHDSMRTNEAALANENTGALVEGQHRQIQQLDARISRLEAMLLQRPASQLHPSGGSAVTPENEDRNADARAFRDQAVFAQMFASDPRGTESTKWNAVATRAFNETMVLEASDQPSTREVECRQRICAVHAVFPPGADSEAWSTRLAMALSTGFGSSRVISRQLPSGESELVMYAFRKGAENLLVDPVTGATR